jgi:hypothetical protein
VSDWSKGYNSKKYQSRGYGSKSNRNYASGRLPLNTGGGGGGKKPPSGCKKTIVPLALIAVGALAATVVGATMLIDSLFRL